MRSVLCTGTVFVLRSSSKREPPSFINESCSLLLCRKLELKWKNGLSADSLDIFADEALTQIDNMRYDSEMKQEGINDILKFGIAFSGKKVRVKTK